MCPFMHVSRQHVSHQEVDTYAAVLSGCLYKVLLWQSACQQQHGVVVAQCVNLTLNTWMAIRV